MSKKIALIGHCGPDSSYLRMAIGRAVRDAEIIAADDATSLDRAIENGVELLLFNRVLDYGFEVDFGVELIRQLRPKYPNLKMMLITNHDDAQQAAIKSGALPGFGKREIGSPRVTQLLQAAVAEQSAVN